MALSVRFMAVERLEAIASHALIAGYGTLHTWDDNGRPRRLVTLELAGECLDARGVELHARYSAQHGKPVKPLTVSMRVRCRKCEQCRAWRTKAWVARSLDEYGRSPMTWFGTLTWRLEEHFRADCALRADEATRQRLRIGGEDFDRLPAKEQFVARARLLGEDVTRFLKRLRKGQGSHKPVFRYLMVAEVHNGPRTHSELRGRPHYHFLFHQQVGDALVKPHEILIQKDNKIAVREQSFLRSNWAHGFSTVYQATDARAAFYLSKYISKSAEVRIRPSFRYGHTDVTSVERNEVQCALPLSETRGERELTPAVA